MQCAKFEQRLQQQLDERQNVEQDELLREHSQGCDVCDMLLRTQSRLFAGLTSLPQPSFGQDLGHRVLDQLQVEQRRRGKKRLMMAALATAAGIMIALLPLAGDVQVRQAGEQDRGGLALVTPPVRQTPASTLTEQQSDDLRNLVRQLMLRLSDHRLGMFEPVDQLAHGIRPLAMTFHLALDTLRRTLPGYVEPQPVEPQAIYGGFRAPIS